MEITKPLMIMLMINLIITISGVSLFNDGITNNFFNVDGQQVTGVTEDFQDSTPSSDESFIEDPGGTTLSIIDVLGVVKDFGLLLINIAFAPLALLTAAGMPWVVKLFVGVPLTMLQVLGVVSFFRSGQ